MIAILLWCAAWAATASARSTLLFEKDVRPILKTHCFHCHGENNERNGGLDVRLRRFLNQGGDSGPAIVPGDPANSHLVELLKAGDMPQGKPRLADAQIALIEQWIAIGAPTARPEPEALGPEYVFTDEERAWWSFQPIARPAVPSGPAHPIDAFLQRSLERAGLSFSVAADPTTQIRRATFDLIGLPPSPKEVDDFAAAFQEDPDRAFLALVDGLLDSPAYGERWARHWLDVAGYADSDGYVEQDLPREHAYRYRDYVIRALNDDMPYDQFVREQLAGDELAAELQIDANADSPDQRAEFERLVTATGFLRMAPDGTGVKNDLAARHASITATMQIVSTALYGMTIGCAQCHDHRYDAISQADYYRLRAVFDPGFDVANWRVPTARLVSLQTKEEQRQAAEIESEAKKVDDARLAKQEEFITEVLGKELAKADEASRDALRKAYRTAAAERTAQQIDLLKQHPRINQLNAGSLYLYDSTYQTKHAETLKAMADEAAAVRAKKPPTRCVRAFNEVARDRESVPASFVFHRGDPAAPREEVEPGDLSVLATYREVAIPPDTQVLPTTGRRLALARLLTDGSHPLLARALVNRVWMHHFGKGIVPSVADFGVLGNRPTHPELLDWLAADFMDHGWSLKRLHRQIMTSQAWRQSSRRDAARERVDPDNLLVSRQNLRRLEAEALRDALLTVSGKLNSNLYGPPVPITYTPDGQIVVGVDTTDSSGRPTGEYIPLNGEEFRRSIYVQVRRSRPLDLLAVFDAPNMTEANCDVRTVTTVSPQSLLLMNYVGMREFAYYFAERLRTEHADDLSRQIDEAWRLAFGRSPGENERASAADFVRAQTSFYQEHPAKKEHVLAPEEKEDAPADLLGLAVLCQALISANEFLYID